MKIMKFFESLYHFLSGSKNFLYDSHVLNPVIVPVPVVSVGNLSFGGVGKTPCIILLAQHFSRNYKIAIVTKSYKTDLDKPTKVDLKRDNAATMYGDEACLIQSKLPFCDVWSGPSKSATAVAALDSRPQLILVDDGFSHRKLHRNFDLVLIDATEGFETYLRESASNLARAHAVLITKVNIANPVAVEKIFARIRQLAPNLKNNIFVSEAKTFLKLDKADPLFVFLK